jgi:tripartite-type tricarboxylate transporter receptor subunit TctC
MISKINRRGMLALTGLASSHLLSTLHAQTTPSAYPSKPIKIVITFPPGGSADTMARSLSDRLSGIMKQSFVIDNKPGAGGGIGAVSVAKAANDGYTLLMGVAGAMSINPSLYKNLSYDPIQDFSPISLIGKSPIVLVASSTATENSVSDLIAKAKLKPEELTYASTGNGTIHHLTGEMFCDRSKIKMTHVPYSGTTQALQDVISGRVPYGFLDLTLALPLIGNGRIKALATSGLSRSSASPNIPTIAESGIPGFDTNGWFGLFAPKGTPKNIIDFINSNTRSILETQEFKLVASNMAVDAVSSSPQELSNFLKSEIEKWKKVIIDANVTI